MSVGEADWRLGITRREYVAIEDGERPPSSNEYEAICEFFGWPDARRQWSLLRGFLYTGVVALMRP